MRKAENDRGSRLCLREFGAWEKHNICTSNRENNQIKPMNCSMPGLPVHHQLPKFTQTHVHRVGDASQPSHPLSSPSPPAPNPSQHQGHSSESTLCMRWPKYWSFSFSIISSKEIPGPISFRMDWLALLAVQGILTSLLQHHSSKEVGLRKHHYEQN